MLGEMTPKMAEAVMSSPAEKLLIPLTQEKVEIIGLLEDSLPHLVKKAVHRIKEAIENV